LNKTKWFAVPVLVLALAGCTAQDVVIASLDAIELGATIAIATQSDPATVAVLEAVAKAVPLAITEYRSTDPAATKATVIAADFDLALASANALSPQDQAIVGATILAVQTLLTQLQQTAVTSENCPEGNCVQPALTRQQTSALAAIAARNDQLRVRIAAVRTAATAR